MIIKLADRLEEKMQEIVDLKASFEADLQACATRLEDNTTAMNMAAARIEALETALLTAFSWLDPDCVPDEEYRKIRAALAPEQDR